MQQPQHSNAKPISRKLLKIYLADHLAGSTAGCGRMSRMATAHADTPHGDRLSEISSELQKERAFLQRIMRKLRLGHHPLRQFIAWAGERLGRLKGNGRLVTASPLTLLLELEIMRSAVAGKLGLWQTLQANAHDLRLDAHELDVLIDQTRRQAEDLELLHEYARLRSIRAGGDSSVSQREHTSATAGRSEGGDTGGAATAGGDKVNNIEAPVDVAERPGTSHVNFEHADSLADEWGKESFPASDPPAHY